jgi:arabinofuranosyltransferase
VLHGLYVTRVGGDFLHARMLLPAVFAISLPVSTLTTREFKWFGPVVVPWAVICVVWAQIPSQKDSVGIERGRLNFISLSKNDHPVTVADYSQMGWGIEADKLFHQMDELQRSSSQPGNGFYSGSANSPPKRVELEPWVRSEVVAYRGAVGLFSYKGRQRMHVCDYHGLADPIAARLELLYMDKKGVWRSGRGKPGHEKHVRQEWCLARVATPGSSVPQPEQQVRDALACGDLAELQAAVTERLTWRRFWRNVAWAPRLTRLRIPQDLAEARAKFCGPA